jgi:VanZ family protein
MAFSKLLKYWFPVFLWMLWIFWMSTDSFSAENTSNFFEPIFQFFFPSLNETYLDLINALVRKAAHIAEYFILGIVMFRAFRNVSPHSWNRKWAVYAVIAAAMYAMSDEFHQSFVASRTASLSDVGFDTFGCVLSVMAISIRSRMKSRTSKSV